MTAFDNPLAVALDDADLDADRRVADAVVDVAGFLKVGSTSFAAGGRPFVEELCARRPVFLDLKLHDIPAQVAGAVRAAADMGASLITVHSSGGADMVAAAVEAAGGDPLVLGVTVLTSLDQRALESVGVDGSVEDQVLRLAELALGAGARGLVCSPLEVTSLRERFGAQRDDGPLLVVPGIRPDGVHADDQRRTKSPRVALDAGADVIVVGRAITGAADPAAAARSILGSLGT